jgi:sec-independent protein translocase protein TatB
MPSFSDSIFLFILALLLFGPKKLPVLAREIGKWVGEFRRASNEFKMQMEDELRATEQADRNRQIAAMEAAAPTALPEPEHPHLDTTSAEACHPSPQAEDLLLSPATEPVETHDGILPIATSGELKIMPPATGLPQPQKKTALADMLNAIPPVEKETEAVHHGD